MNCIFCKREINNKGSLISHQMRCKENPSATKIVFDYSKRRNENQYSKAKNEGKEIKVSYETREKLSKSAKKQIWSVERRDKLSKIAKRNGLGGHTSKRRLHYTMKNGETIYLQSSYEIEFAKILDDHDIIWSRPDPFIWIDESGVDHRYYPDFKVGDIYFDTKNDYLAIKDLPKIKAVRNQNDIRLYIVTKDYINKDFAGIAQLVEQLTCNEKVDGSIPSAGTKYWGMGRAPRGSLQDPSLIGSSPIFSTNFES